jgi:hypothetical protein
MRKLKNQIHAENSTKITHKNISELDEEKAPSLPPCEKAGIVRLA